MKSPRQKQKSLLLIFFFISITFFLLFFSKFSNHHQFKVFIFYFSEAAVAGFPYCTEAGLNFSTAATNYGEDDGDFTHGRRGKTSRVSF